MNVMHRGLTEEARQPSPTEHAPAREEDIRARAYAIWEDEGRPYGQHLEHWRRAADEVAALGRTPPPVNGARPKAAEAKAVKPATKAVKPSVSRTTKPKTKA